jgi:hypothetical protein
MAEVFTGDLSQIKLLDILNLLVVEGKTGKVTLRKGNIVGEIFVENGRLIHGTAESSYGEEAVYLMMTWTIGKFSYAPDVLPDSKTITSPTHQILSDSAKRAQEWDRIRTAIPSADTVFRLSSRNQVGDIVLKAEEWNVLIRINGVRTVRETARELGVSEIETAKKLYRLLAADLIEVAETPVRAPRRLVGKAFFKTLQEELTLVMGPMAPVIIEDQVAEMEERISDFPQDRAAELVEGISMEISDEGKRVDFQKEMLEVLRKA